MFSCFWRCSWQPQWQAVFSRTALIGLLCLLASCGGFPRPFEGQPGATAMRLAQPPSPRLTIAPPGDALLPDFAAAGYAAAMAEALTGQDVPAFASAPRKGDWRLVLTAQLQGAEILPMFTVLDATGEQAGIQQGQVVAANVWATAAPATMKATAESAAPAVADLLSRIEASRRASDPNSLVNRPARIAVPDVTGAPGDGNRQLARQMRLQLAELGMLVQDIQQDFTLTGTVVTVPIAGKMTRIEIQWVLLDAQNTERGRIVQLNEIPAGSLDRLWGDVAVVVAQEAAGGVKDVVARQTAARPK